MKKSLDPRGNSLSPYEKILSWVKAALEANNFREHAAWSDYAAYGINEIEDVDSIARELESEMQAGNLLDEEYILFREMLYESCTSFRNADEMRQLMALSVVTDGGELGHRNPLAPIPLDAATIEGMLEPLISSCSSMLAQTDDQITVYPWLIPSSMLPTSPSTLRRLAWQLSCSMDEEVTFDPDKPFPDFKQNAPEPSPCYYLLFLIGNVYMVTPEHVKTFSGFDAFDFQVKNEMLCANELTQKISAALKDPYTVAIKAQNYLTALDQRNHLVRLARINDGLQRFIAHYNIAPDAVHDTLISMIEVEASENAPENVLSSIRVGFSLPGRMHEVLEGVEVPLFENDVEGMLELDKITLALNALGFERVTINTDLQPNTCCNKCGVPYFMSWDNYLVHPGERPCTGSSPQPTQAVERQTNDKFETDEFGHSFGDSFGDAFGDEGFEEPQGARYNQANKKKVLN